VKLIDLLPQLTIQPLRRFADAWSVKTIKSDKRDVFEQAILSEIGRIDTDVVVRERLAIFERELDYVRRSNAERLLRLILDEPGYAFPDEGGLISRLVTTEATFREYALSNTATRHLEPLSVDIYQSVLEVAWENRVSFDEYQLIRRLQRKLDINRRDHRVMEIRVGSVPIVGPAEAEQALRDLNYHGFVCQFKLRGHTQVVVPEELALRLRSIYGISLQSGAYRNLTAKLPMSAIRETLEQAKQPSVSLRKDFLVERLIDGDVPPANVLDKLDNNMLDELLAEFTSQKPPSMRAVKMRHLIAYFDQYTLTSSNGDEPSDPDKVYYDYLAALAARQYEVLRAASVIQHDQNVDRAFERGVRYAFSSLFGHPAIQFTGNAHADGGIAAKRGRMVLWDCKSALTPYALTEPKCAQFLQYIMKEVPNVVCPFLIISGDFTGESAARALALKASCPRGTEIGLITATDLKWLADKWGKEYSDKLLPLDVLAHSGLLSLDILELRMKLFAGQAQDR
jgi:hypothetical protein